MKKYFKLPLILSISIPLILSGCGKGNEISPSPTIDKSVISTQPSDNNASAQPTQVSPSPVPSIDVSQVKPNEVGKIMVVMFHNFVASFTPTKYDKGEYTTTFNDFRNLLPQLYEKGYRLISVDDYLNNNISVPAGTIPMVFTFDDGTSGQFNLVNEGGKLVANKQSAVGIMEEFSKTHPDFGLKGTFYVNLGGDTFNGEGTMPERLQYLIDQGFEIGNHTLNHVHLNEVKSADKILEEVGGNQKKMLEIIPGYQMKSLALPFGQATKSLQSYVEKGEYQGVKYQNFALMEVGWDPTYSPVSKKINLLSTHRVRASGISPVDADLAWWIKNFSKNEQYVSDGNPNTVTVPKDNEIAVDSSKLNGKQLIVY